jgi:quaternary ammonium compound-resistance protein SugE
VAWVILVCAGLMEVVWAFFMKKSAGFALLWPSLVTVVAMLASVALLSVSMKSLPLGTAYMVWTGIGAVGAFVVGIVFLGEAATLPHVFAAALIVAGILMMKFSSAE